MIFNKATYYIKNGKVYADPFGIYGMKTRKEAKEYLEKIKRGK